jgi:hypothetical protein
VFKIKSKFKSALNLSGKLIQPPDFLINTVMADEKSGFTLGTNFLMELGTSKTLR